MSKIITRAEMRGRERAQLEANKKAAWEWEHGGKQKAWSDEQAQKRADADIGGDNDYDTTPFVYHRP
jgi:hypothetical protein